MMDGCPGSRMQDFREKENTGDQTGKRASELRQWPIQLHLVSPMAPYYQKADVLLSADCVAYTAGDFHKDYLKGKSIAIACPKLDEGQDEYVEKIQSLIDGAKINTLTVMTMQVPCCQGLVGMASRPYSRQKERYPLNPLWSVYRVMFFLKSGSLLKAIKVPSANPIGQRLQIQDCTWCEISLADGARLVLHQVRD